MIRKWLGINDDFTQLRFELRVLENRVDTQDTQMREVEDGGQIFDGIQPKENSMKELVYGICQYLKIRPRREFYQEPDVCTMVTKRKFWVEKIKK